MTLRCEYLLVTNKNPKVDVSLLQQHLEKLWSHHALLIRIEGGGDANVRVAEVAAGGENPMFIGDQTANLFAHRVEWLGIRDALLAQPLGDSLEDGIAAIKAAFAGQSWRI